MDREPESFEQRISAATVEELKKRRATGYPLATGESLDSFLARTEDTSVDSMLSRLGEELPKLLRELPAEGSVEQAARPEPAPEADLGQNTSTRRDTSRSHRLLEPLVGDPAISGHEDVVDRMLAQLTRRQPVNVLLHGPAGSGKTAAVTQLVGKARSGEATGSWSGMEFRRLRVDLVLASDPVAALGSALDDVREDEVVVVDDLETLLGLGGQSVFGMLLMRLRAALADRHQRVLMVVDDKYRDRLDAIDEELYGHLSPVSIEPLATRRVHEVARGHAASLAELHGVSISEDVALLAAAPPSKGDSLSHPGLAISRLEGAAAFAALRGRGEVLADDLSVATEAPVEAVEAASLIAELRKRVRGQDKILSKVANRLSLTRANLDLRPERPDSVFLFVGPTGVGKTELARALCKSVFGDESNLIRLDMSEYAQSWALSRLIGPQAGYVGSDQPSGWLTTRVAAQPNSLILLDEIEKADPAIWNAFLQVFDAGRLSDSRGTVADFSKTVIVMTSNLGADAFEAAPFGFADESDDSAHLQRGRESVLGEVRRRMAPELINRLDDILIFEPLSVESIREIADSEVGKLGEELRRRGFEVEIPDDVVAVIAETGYDPAFGARHLQRNIERLLLEPLASAGRRSLVAEVRGDEVVWRPSG